MKPSDHHFLNLLGQLGGKLVQDTLDQKEGRKGDFRFEPTRPLQWHEAYLREVLLKAGELVSTCEQIEQSVAFMSNFRSTAGLKKSKITRLDHIRYHIENHLIRMISAGDRALILTISVFRLGIKPRDCKHHLILGNEYVEGTEVATDLKEMARVIQPFREERNTVVHKKTYSHEDMRFLEAAYLLKKTEDNPLPEYWTKRETDEFVAARKEEMKDVNADLFQAVCELFTDLQRVFEHNFPTDQHAV